MRWYCEDFKHVTDLTVHEMLWNDDVRNASLDYFSWASL